MIFFYIIQKWGTSALQPPSGINLKETNTGKFSEHAEFLAVLIVIYFVWKEKWSDVIVH